MEHKIISQQKNPFLQREEILIEMTSATAPSFEDVKKAVGKDEKLVVVKKVDGQFGQHIFIADVVVYDSEKAKKNVEIVPQKTRKKIAEDEKKKIEEEKKQKEEAKKAEEKAKAEVPVEETKVEEVKSE